jgi:transcription termination factor Rho
VLVDGLDGATHRSRAGVAAARAIRDGGSGRSGAVASEPLGGETTVIAFDAALASTARFPALDLVAKERCAQSCWSARGDAIARREPRHWRS